MKIARISREEVDAFPQGAIWNAFVGLLAMAEISELSDEQIPAWHAFGYESEVQNGGHLQYFVNRGAREASQCVLSLRRLGAPELAEILGSAVKLWESAERRHPSNVEEYVEEALEGEFSGIDERFGSANPSLSDILERYLAENQALFVEIQEAL